MGPVPPIDMLTNHAAERGALYVMIALCAAALVFALWHWARSGRPVGLLMFLSGGAMMVMEPMADTVGGCWFPKDSMIFYMGWGRPIPLWLCLTYFAYFGLGAAILWTMMERGISRTQLWAFFLGEIVADIVLETVLLNLGVYTYYGHQPLLFAGFPLWWAPVNALVSVTAAYVTLRLARAVSGWQLLLLIPALLSTSAAANGAAGWPSWFAINTDIGGVATQACGVASCLLACALVHLIGLDICRTAKAPSVGRRGEALAADPA